MSLEKAVDPVAGLGERGSPPFERLAAALGQLIRALGGAGQGVVPLAPNEALLLERSQDAVEIADIDPLLADQLGQAVEQVVPVGRALAKEQQERRHLEALDSAAMPAVSAMVIHMYDTYSRTSACG